MRLPAKRDLRAEQEELSLSHGSVDNGNPIFKVAFPPGPAAPERRLGVEPGNRPNRFQTCIGAKPEEILDFCRARGFSLVKLKCGGVGLGCNEFVFLRDAEHP